MSLKKILIVEDVEFNVDLLVQLLEDDYALEIAVDGQQAVLLAEKIVPDLILMDISLPIMDGYEATQIIKSNPALSHIPIFGLSAHAMSDDVQKALDAGCSGYFTKPLDEELLFDKLDELFG